MAPKDDALYYHSAIMIAFDLNYHTTPRHSKISPEAEAVIYTPHGIHVEDVEPLPTANPPLRTLALLHGMHDIKLTSKQLNLGAHNGLQVQRLCKANYWVSTHDEIKTARGLIAPFLYRKVFTLQHALDHERQKQAPDWRSDELTDAQGMVFADMASGESLLLC